MTKGKIDFRFYARRRLLNEEMGEIWNHMVNIYFGREENRIVMAMNDFTLVPDVLGDCVRFSDERGFVEMGSRYRANEGKPQGTARKL